MAPTVGRSVVACSAVSCLDRAGSYSRLQCDKRGMRPSPRSAGPAHGRTRSKLLLLPPKSGVSPLPPPLAPRRIQCYRLRITANDATPTPPSVSPYTRREHSLTHSLTRNAEDEARQGCLPAPSAAPPSIRTAAPQTNRTALGPYAKFSFVH